MQFGDATYVIDIVCILNIIHVHSDPYTSLIGVIMGIFVCALVLSGHGSFCYVALFKWEVKQAGVEQENKQSKCTVALLGRFTVDCCGVMDGLWHLRRLGPKPSGPQQHAEPQLLHQLHSLWLKTSGAHCDISIWNEACTVRTVSNTVQHYPTLIFLFSAFMCFLCCRLRRGHPPTCTLWALQFQHPSMAGFSLFLSPPFFLSSLFSPWWWYPCHVVMATIGPWLLGC